MSHRCHSGQWWALSTGRRQLPASRGGQRTSVTAVRIATQVSVVCFMTQQVTLTDRAWEQRRGVAWYAPNMASVLIALLHTSVTSQVLTHTPCTLLTEEPLHLHSANQLLDPAPPLPLPAAPKVN